MQLLTTAKHWASRIKRDVIAVYFAARNPETPMLARMLAFAVAAYALSPIDLIPDFIPVIGYLDDLILVPLGILIVVRLLPMQVLSSSRAKAEALLARPRSNVVAFFIVFVWLACFTALAYWMFRK